MRRRAKRRVAMSAGAVLICPHDVDHLVQHVDEVVLAVTSGVGFHPRK